MPLFQNIDTNQLYLRVEYLHMRMLKQTPIMLKTRTPLHVDAETNTTTRIRDCFDEQRNIIPLNGVLLQNTPHPLLQSLHFPLGRPLPSLLRVIRLGDRLQLPHLLLRHLRLTPASHPHLDDAWREIAQLRHVDSKRLIRCPVANAIQHRDVILPREGGHVHIAHIGIILGDFRQLEVVRGEQAVTIRDRGDNMLQNAPRQSQAIVPRWDPKYSQSRGRASTQLINHNQAVCVRIVLGAGIQDVGHVDHLVHECRHAARLVVRRADSGVKRGKRRERGRFRGDEAPDLGHDDDDAKLR